MVQQILKKEFNTFFSSNIGYLIVAIFLLANGLFLWVFKTEFNILNAGFADLSAFFNLTPWVFLFIIPAITMKSFVEEYNSGTIEILKTKPISNWQIVMSKFLGTSAILLVALIPTVIYLISIYLLSFPTGNIDLGSILGSYLGLLFIGLVFNSIGIFSSSISKSQVGAFLVAIVLCFITFYGFNIVSETFLGASDALEAFSGFEYYQNIAKGVIDTRDLIYFLSSTAFFLFLSKMIVDGK